MRVVVYHGSYGCDTGCCGHYIEIDDKELHGSWTFDHPSEYANVAGEYRRLTGDDRDAHFRAWAVDYVRSEIEKEFGKDHVFDLDWKNSVVIDD